MYEDNANVQKIDKENQLRRNPPRLQRPQIPKIDKDICGYMITNEERQGYSRLASLIDFQLFIELKLP